MDNKNKKSRMSSDYDEDMDWLNDDDDYLEDGGLLGSLLFGDKKKKKKKADARKSVESSDRPARRSTEDTAGRPARRSSEDTGRPARRVAEDTDRPARKNAGKADRPVRKSSDRDTVSSDTRTVSTNRRTESPAEDRPARRRKISDDRTPVRLENEGKLSDRPERKERPVRKPAASVGTAGEYDEYYHEDSRARKAKNASRNRILEAERNARRQIRNDAPESGSSSVDNLLREVNNLEADSRSKHEELRREAWERTQRNVAKAKAEVERLEFEREQNEKEEARKLRVQQEMQRRQEEADRIQKARKAEKDVDQDVKAADKEAEIPDADVQETKAVESGIDTAENITSDNTAGMQPEETVTEEIPESAPADQGDAYDDVSEDIDDEETNSSDIDIEDEDDNTDSPAKRSDMLDMDELERIEKDIDEDKLSYSESDTADLGLGEIGKALGFDAVELEDDEEEPEEDTESDSEKFFRENLLDEADPKVVNPERKKLNISTKVWAIAFFVLLAMFILICVIYVKNYARMKYNEMDINEISEDQLLTNTGVKEATSGYRTIALYGVDSRGQNLGSGTNSDSIMIVSINESTQEIKLVSVYRDTLMEIASGSMNVNQKVNYAYQVGGPVTAINTLNTNLDLNITDYVAVDFNAMASIIDAVGGVDVNILDDEVNNFNKNLAEQISLSGTYSSGITEAGQYTLDGQQAVAYSRIRSTGQGDITRTERQRIVLMKIIDKLLQADTGSLDSFVDVSFKCISTSLNKDDIHNLVKSVAKYKVVDTAGFPFAYETADITDKGNCIVAADMAANVQALHEYLYGTKNYRVSSEAAAINSSLAEESGVKAQKVIVSTENPGNGIKDDGEDGDLRTIKEPPKGMIVEE